MVISVEFWKFMYRYGFLDQGSHLDRTTCLASRVFFFRVEIYLHLIRAVGRPSRQATSPNIMQNLDVVPCGIRLLPHGDDLPQEDPERPNVRLASEDPVNQRLGGHPPDGQHALAFFAVVVVFVNIPGESEVPDFDDARLGVAAGHKAVPGREVAVHEVHFLQVPAPSCHVDAHCEKIG